MAASGRRFREWTLHEEVGRGGMGVVYRATHLHVPSQVFAIKVLRPELGADPEARGRLLREARVLWQSQHPHIVRAELPFEEDGVVYLPMEWLEGQTLDTLLSLGPGSLPPHEAAAILAQAAAGVGYAHTRPTPILHRDLKPSNLFVLRDGCVKVLDFGLARIQGCHSLGRAGFAVGTPLWLAPEVLEGQEPTPRGDVYALGLIGYRMLTGRLPFDVAADAPTLAAIRAVDQAHHAGLPDVRAFAPELPAALASIIMACVSTVNAARPADGAVLSALLAAWAESDRMATPGSADTPRLQHTNTRLGVADTSHLHIAIGSPTSIGDERREDVDAERGNRRDAPVAADTSELGIRLGAAPFVQTAARSAGWTETPRANPASDPSRVVTVTAPTGATATFRFVRVPPGIFLMGADEADREAFRDERPAHPVTLTRPCYLLATPVTQAQWSALVGNNPSFCRGSQGGAGSAGHPVENVSWFDAVAFCNALSEALGLPPAYVLDDVAGRPGTDGFRARVRRISSSTGIRLPTEAEWEHACRGDTTAARYGALDEIAWHRGNAEGGTRSVASRRPNAYGLYDMLGNVWEWVEDWYDPLFYSNPAASQPDPSRDSAPIATPARALRGSSWYYNDASALRASARVGDTPMTRWRDYGFRCLWPASVK